ncbi:MAG: glycosyltransferase family 2 protein [Oscillospiraceae bacterium]|nr:glycosyltransferase family 2 protein [Oscillospiraceae bacterium]
MSGKVSIIVPVYNTERYLVQCVDSILTQTYKDLELILVNDGSKDSSLKICQEYEEKDSRVVVIDKANGGAAESRNYGILRCTGNWIMFMDSDDYYQTDDVISKVISKAEATGCDMVLFNYRRFYEDKNTYSANMYSLNGKEADTDTIIASNIYTSSVCIKLTKASFIKENNILFPVGEIAEDIGFCADLLRLKPKMSFCEDAVYVYRDRKGSKTNSIGEAYIKDAYNIVKRLMSVNNDDENYMAFVAFQYCTLLINMNFAKVDKNLRKEIYSLHHILKYDKIFKVRLIYTADRIFGTAFTSKLLFTYFKMSK